MLPIFSPSFFNNASVHLHRHVIERVEVEFAHGKVHRALFIGGGSAWFEEFRGVVVFLHMLLPEVFRAVKSGRIYSVKGRAEKWFREFISAAECVSQLDEVKYVRPQDLLNSAFRTEIFVDTIRHLTKNLEEVEDPPGQEEKRAQHRHALSPAWKGLR